MSGGYSEVKQNPLWPLLVETAKANPLYAHHLAYIRDRVLPNAENLDPRELSARLGIPLGEVLVILDELGKL